MKRLIEFNFNSFFFSFVKFLQKVVDKYIHISIMGILYAPKMMNFSLNESIENAPKCKLKRDRES